MDTVYYVYECVPCSRYVEGLVTADKKHWWVINSGLIKAVKHLSMGEGWQINDYHYKPGELLYTSETHPELFI